MRRPVSVTIVAWLYMAVGAIGFVAHFVDSVKSPGEGVWIELTELLALVCGVFLLRGKDWARWGALAWMAFHVVLSVFRNVRELAVHCVFLAAIAWILLRPAAARYFRGRAA